MSAVPELTRQLAKMAVQIAAESVAAVGVRDNQAVGILLPVRQQIADALALCDAVLVLQRLATHAP